MIWFIEGREAEVISGAEGRVATVLALVLALVGSPDSTRKRGQPLKWEGKEIPSTAARMPLGWKRIRLTGLWCTSKGIAEKGGCITKAEAEGDITVGVLLLSVIVTSALAYEKRCQ